ncbi:protein of unknown function [Nitrospira japonica]|uniref:Uncharacterized protein n=1 Tax=Nitrospira japonica TaxID=1325564 RepID=A0A1W1I5Q2_9BACT|nr:protein of unknown function [Nitrospira japonica]
MPIFQDRIALPVFWTGAGALDGWFDEGVLVWGFGVEPPDEELGGGLEDVLGAVWGVDLGAVGAVLDGVTTGGRGA